MGTSTEMETRLAKLKEAEWDSSTSDEEVEEETSIETQKDFVKLAKCTKKPQDEKSSVIYLGRIPHGFYEEQMRGFFQQFGDVLRLRLSRNRKTGKSKHFAFIEFADPSVAEIVADTMDKYHLFDHVLSCQVVPKENIHKKMFDGADAEFRPVDWKAVAQRQHNQPKSYEQKKRNLSRLLKKDEKKRQRLEQLGIDFDFKGYVATVAPSAKHMKFEE